MLLKNENQIIRVLKSQGDKALVIDCIKRTMPHWVDSDFLSNLVDCGEDEMYERTDYPFGRELTPKEERIAQERFTMISGVLPFIGNESKRNQMIDFLAEHQSKQTIRKYLCLYLVYQDTQREAAFYSHCTAQGYRFYRWVYESQLSYCPSILSQIHFQCLQKRMSPFLAVGLPILQPKYDVGNINPALLNPPIPSQSNRGRDT